MYSLPACLQAKTATALAGQTLAAAGHSQLKASTAAISAAEDAPAKKPEPAPPPVVNLIDLMDGPAAAPVLRHLTSKPHFGWIERQHAPNRLSGS